MQRRTKSQEAQVPVDGRVAAINRILTIARLIRKQGTPEQASEAIEWEKQLEKRLAEIERTSLATAA